MPSPVSNAGSAAITAAPVVAPSVAAEEAEGAEPSDALVVDVYRSFADLAPFRAEWDDFMEAIGAEIFLTDDWLATWWKYYGKDRPLLIACVRHRGALIAALPLYLDRISFLAFSLRVIRIVDSIYMPVTLTLPVQRSRLAEALPRLIAVVSDEWRWDLIHLGVLSGKCKVIPQIRDALASCHPLVEEPVIRQTGVQTYFYLEADWDAYVARLNKSKRYHLKNCLKEITKNKYVVFSHLAGANDFSAHFESFHRQHQDHWRDRGLPGDFRDWPDAYAFHREVAATSLNRDRLRLLEIHVNGKIAAYEYMYKFAQTYNSFLGFRGLLNEKKESHTDASPLIKSIYWRCATMFTVLTVCEAIILIKSSSAGMRGRRAGALGYRIVYAAAGVVFHPARPSVEDILVKWGHTIDHEFAEWQAAGRGLLAWCGRALAVAASPVVDGLRIVGSNRLAGLRPRALAALALVRIRLWRARRMLSLVLFGPSKDAFAWNR